MEPLLEIAHNLWWSWHPEAVELFVRLDRDLWEGTGHNPVKMLGLLDQRVLERVAEDQSYLHALGMVHARFKHHNERMSWFQRQYPSTLAPSEGESPMRVAYFSAEFGLTECFQIYSGGLGCLAGDHLKAASELGVPMCAVGLLYRNGYFHQYLNADGWQQETYPDLEFANQPIRRVTDDEGEAVTVSVDMPGRTVILAVWRCDVGRVPLYLLDANLPENAPEDRDITKSLYGGDIETRIQQEIVLGIGGVRALEAVGERVNVFHINEGHAAFLALERMRRLREEHRVSFEGALRAGCPGNIFTTHTPVPAGIDRFSPELVTRYIGPMADALGCDLNRLLSLGRSNPFNENEFFSMAVLALRTSQFAGGVSKLHGEVARSMWNDMWPGTPANEVPIGHVTNGVHPRTWISHDLVALYDRYLGPDWQLDPADVGRWEQAMDIPDEELWRVKCRSREKLIAWTRRRVREQLEQRGAVPDEIEQALAPLDPDVFTIGFARRFATYKRGTLLMSDVERLENLLSGLDGTPVQILIAGKAHPADRPGKELIRRLVKLSASSPTLRRIVFLEDYDMNVARWMVQGCDLWLNTPLRGMEASGTSGMKCAMNGVINCSILDGWWDEAYDPEVGFAIGRGEHYEDREVADAIESRALYDVLERQILPEFYERDASGIPRKWVRRMKSCIGRLTPRFSTIRMVADYVERYYLISYGLSKSMLADGLAPSESLAGMIAKYHEQWPSLGVRRVWSDDETPVAVRTPVRLRAEVALGSLEPSEVRVQAVHGVLNDSGDLIDAELADMRLAGADEGTRLPAGVRVFEGVFTPSGSGQCGVSVRVVPKDDRLVGTRLPGLIAWDHGESEPLGAREERPRVKKKKAVEADGEPAQAG
ncbi:MAG: alpha-glucan family phosphorylase [Planctomycetota bacterium]